ncbi:MAG: DUF3872 domain-containing protein [Prevotellaceae bacterium]|jgi:hypothetical protein|nr:DUF3872 domain-containing protein [Prevotellaceae bacterium]
MKNIITILLLIFFSYGCSNDLDLKQDYDFEIEMLPIPRTITPDVPVEIRFELNSIGGSYDSAMYYVRYFQYVGKGTLTDESGTTFFPNDSYRLTKKKFRLYFQP